MKKGLLAVAALTGAAFTANAALLKINDQTFANFGLKMQIYGQSLEDAANGGKDNAIDFTVQNTRVYFSGQLNPIVQFGANLDFAVTGSNTSHEGTSKTKVRDAFINFHFMPEINVMAGYYRIPFSRATLVDRYNTIFMRQDGWVTVNGVYKDQILPTLKINAGNNKPVALTVDNVLGGPSLGNAVAITQTTDEADFARDAGVTVWGDILNGMVKYYAGVYDGFGDHNAGEVVANNGKDNLGYVIRLEFTPTMLGFQPEKGYLHKETYLGKKNTLTVGVAYAASKLDLGNNSSFDFKSWTIDANWEQKLNLQGFALVPKLEAGYVYTDGDDLPLYYNDNNKNTANLDKVKTFYIKAGTLFDKQIWLGKLGIYVKYQKTKVELDKGKGVLNGDIEPSVWTVTVPYYLAGQNAKIALQWNHYDYDKNGMDPRNSKDDTNNDFTLAFQVQF
jgi:hypothetical protein